MLSVVIPAYNEEPMINKTADTICRILNQEKIAHELVFVNDGSKDQTWTEIGRAAKEYPSVRGVCLSKNFGKESAIFAGLSESKGDCVVVMDCDLQHPPEKIVEMYRKWEEGYEIIEGVKQSRGKESRLHALAARCFYHFISEATDIDMTHASDFKLLDRKAVNVLLNIPEKNAFFRALSSWVGFRSTNVAYDVQERDAGESKWSTKALIRYAITNITSFTTLPMQIVTFFGIIMLGMGVILSIQALYQKIVGAALGGFTTVIILQCFSSSVIMISLGIIGYYIAKIFEEVQGRPRFIISEREDGNGDGEN
ncbi:MAG: glycosyltransferase family 2 protein [Lachnospiraceae bacterium]|nr:glycosyltransferase family 2 protein [Lachnospiraceae bacterium]